MGKTVKYEPLPLQTAEPWKEREKLLANPILIAADQLRGSRHSRLWIDGVEIPVTSMELCETHQEYFVSDDGPCPQCRIAALESELAEAKRIIARFRPCKVCKGSGDHKTEDQRWGKPSRNNCRYCNGFGYVLTGNRSRLRAAIDEAGGE